MSISGIVFWLGLVSSLFQLHAGFPCCNRYYSLGQLGYWWNPDFLANSLLNFTSILSPLWGIAFTCAAALAHVTTLLSSASDNLVVSESSDILSLNSYTLGCVLFWLHWSRWFCYHLRVAGHFHRFHTVHINCHPHRWWSFSWRS